LFGGEAGERVGRQRMQLLRGRPGGVQLGQSRVSDGARGRRRHLPRTFAMVPALRITCKAPKAKLFMNRRDFLRSFRGEELDNAATGAWPGAGASASC
jgi:hypothetical protein